MNTRTLITACALGLAALLSGCAAGGGGGVPPGEWRLDARPTAEGVLVSWNVPRASGRKVVIEAVPQSGVVDERIRLSYGSSDPGYDLVQLPPGAWRLQGSVNDGGKQVGPTRIYSEGFVVDAADAIVRPLRGSDLGLDAPLGVSALVAVPAWSGDEDLREALLFAAEQSARVAFGEAWRLAEPGELERLLAAREELSAPFPSSLDARLLMVCDLRPSIATGDDATLVVRLHDLACENHGSFRPRSGSGLPSRGSTLLAQAYVDVPGLDPAAGLLATRPFVTALRGALADVLAGPAFTRVLPALVAADVWDAAGQEALRDALRGVRLLDAPEGADHELVERELIFPRRPAPVAAPDVVPDEPDDDAPDDDAQAPSATDDEADAAPEADAAGDTEDPGA